MILGGMEDKEDEVTPSVVPVKLGKLGAPQINQLALCFNACTSQLYVVAHRLPSRVSSPKREGSCMGFSMGRGNKC